MYELVSEVAGRRVLDFVSSWDMVENTLEAQFQKRLVAAMRSKDSETANVIKMIKTRVMERRTSKGFSGEVNDALYLEVIAAYQKQMLKAQAEYKKLGAAGETNVVELQQEIDFCAEYLPKPLSTTEVKQAVQTAITELGATDTKMVGRIVGAVMKKHKGRVDAGSVKTVASELLA